MHGRRLGAPDDRQRNRVVRVTAETADLKVCVAGVQRVSECRGWLGGPLIPEHALIPGHTSELIGLLPRLGGPFGGHPNVTTIEEFAGFGAHRADDQSVSALAGQVATAWAWNDP